MDISPATPEDLTSVEALLAAAGLPLAGVAEALCTGVVAYDDQVLGAAAVEPYGSAALLRSVVVSQEHRGTGIGRALVTAAEHIALTVGATQMYLLTETADSWFATLGYRTIGRDEVPSAVAGSIEFTEACASSAIAMHRSLDLTRVRR